MRSASTISTTLDRSAPSSSSSPAPFLSPSKPTAVSFLDANNDPDDASLPSQYRRSNSLASTMQFRSLMESNSALQWWLDRSTGSSPTTTSPRRARVMATHSRRESRKKPSSPNWFDRTQENTTTSVSCPWKESTVPTRTSPSRRSASSVRISWTCFEYGLITATSVALTSPPATRLPMIFATMSASAGFDLPPKLWVASLSGPTCTKARCWSTDGHGKPRGGLRASSSVSSAHLTRPL
mmetsp:Transcript_21120/g.60282  ORF Transcript_21120/g.60282 Transcript_21120/m.60282 type:complete len:239 (+) Transcript_21120:272-988(+)